MPREYIDQYLSDFPEEEITTKQFNDYAKSIGRFMVAFSGFENALDHSLANIINSHSDDLGFTVTSRMFIGAKIDLFSQLYGQAVSAIDRSKKGKLKELIEKIKSLESFRNNIAHANWYSLDKKGFVRVKLKADEEGVSLIKEKITIKLIERRVDEALKLTDELEEYFEKLFSQI